MVADDLYRAGKVAGLVCLGYPFHPPGSPEKLRAAHLAALRCPALICQGTRDPFGTHEEVAGYDLSAAIALHWFEGDHDLKPRKADGVRLDDNLGQAASAIADWTGA
jgi:predicted alpha/beta-hydrolase family hydrolase